MADHAETMDHPISQREYNWRSTNNRLGLWLFLFSDAFVFGALLIVRFYLMPDARPELNQNLGLIVTSVLLLSSFFMNRAEVAAGAGDQKNFSRFTLLTMLLGIAFLLGVVLVEWREASHFITTDVGVAGGVFYTMTGFHALHVLTGVIFLAIVWSNGRKGLYTKERHFAVEACAIYWHFIDVVWIFFYPALYLIGGTVIGG